MFTQLIKRDPLLAADFRDIVPPTLDAPDRAAYDFLAIANGDTPPLPYRAHLGLDIGEYCEALRERYARLNPDRVRPQVTAYVDWVMTGGFDPRGAEFLLNVADVLPAEADGVRTEVYRRVARAGVDRLDAVASLSQTHLDELVLHAPELGTWVLRRRLAVAAEDGAEWEDLRQMCREALARRTRVGDVLRSIQRWPKLGDPYYAYLFLKELNTDVEGAENAPLDAVARDGLEFLLSGGYGQRYASDLASWIRRYVDLRKRTLDELDQLAKKTKSARSGRNSPPAPAKETPR
jgi:hypothetical protein